MSSSHSSGLIGADGRKGLLYALIASWVVFFALAVAGHLSLHNAWAESLYKSLQLFHLHYHPQPEGAAGVHAVPWTLEVARFGAGLWALALFPTLLAVLFERSVFGWWVRRHWSDHVVVWGHCVRTLNLVLDLHKAGRKVVFIGNSAVPQAQLPRSVYFVEGSIARPDLLKKVAVHRARRLIALNESDVTNLEILVAAEQLCSAARLPRLPPLECSAHFADTYMAGGLYRTVIAAKVQPGAEPAAPVELLWRHGRTAGAADPDSHRAS